VVILITLAYRDKAQCVGLRVSQANAPRGFAQAEALEREQIRDSARAAYQTDIPWLFVK
jgi:hypothetical protein